MTGYQKRNLMQTIGIGLGVTSLVAALSLSGLLAPMERRLSDQRTAWCQFESTPPSDQLVHLDIDDNALDDVHRWPWPRALWAQVMDELRLAGAGTVAFDVLFTEPQQRESELAQQLSQGMNDKQNALQDIGQDDDTLFAHALVAHGRVILPATFALDPVWEGRRASLEELIAHPAWLDSWEAYTAAAAAGAMREQVLDENQYLVARRRALFELICNDLDQAASRDVPFTQADAQKKYFPNLDPALTGGAQPRLLTRQYTRAAAYKAICQSGVILQPPSEVIHASDVTPPVLTLAATTTYSGFVDVIPDPDGVVRHVPVVLGHAKDHFMQLGLALAQLHQDPKIDPATFTRDGMVLRSQPGLAIPHDARGKLVIPWTGPVQDWQGVVGRDQHLAVGYVWEAAKLAGSLRTNRHTADRAVLDLYRLALDPAKAQAMEAAIVLEDDAARTQRVQAVLAELASLGYPDALQQVPAAERSPEEKTILAAMTALGVVNAEIEQIKLLLADRRADLRRRLEGKAVLVGYTASGLGDIITTPLHTRCPGVIAHGAIFNAVMTGQFWSVAPVWVHLAVLLLMGIAGMAMAMAISPALSALAVVTTMAAYAAFNGLVVFDRWNIQLALAGPLMAAGLAWASCTLAGFIAERRERARITRRFQNYVDPTLVAYVLENPDKARLEGEARQMSVVFTDLEGFTKLSSTIHERVVPVINRYLEQMIPPIHAHRGYVNKFLGDGIMFFFGAPRENQKHAQDAVAAILEMQQLMAPFNKELTDEGLPNLRMRAGMTTGRMIVGDAGSGQRSDYTVMGDQVNLAARLESANKACGTAILINDAAADAIHDQYLLRPVGRLQVVGRSQAVMCFEPLCKLAMATLTQRDMVRLTHQLIQAYTEKRWDDCLAACEKLAPCDEACTQLVELYRKNVKYWREHEADAFDGRIELTSK